MLINVELLKLRTVRAPFLLLAVSQLIVVAGVIGAATSADLSDPVTAEQALAHSGLVSLLTLVLGIMAVAGEHRNKTITDTYLSTPRRGRAMAAKFGAYGLAAIVFALCNATTAVVTTGLWWAAEDVPLSLADALPTIVGCFAWNVAFAVIGVGLGALVRNLTAAVAAALAWIALVEGVVGELLGDAARFLPFAAASALGTLDAAAGFSPLAQPTAALVLIAYTALIAAAAIATTARRDIT